MSQHFILHKGDPNRANVLRNAHAFLDRLAESHSWEIDVARHVKKRTDPQNHALFGVAYPALSAETGFTKDELHEAFCKMHFGTVERVIFGEVKRVPLRTTTADENGRRDVIGAEEFGKFYDMVQRIGAEAGVDVPSPDPMKRTFR